MLHIDGYLGRFNLPRIRARKRKKKKKPGGGPLLQCSRKTGREKICGISNEEINAKPGEREKRLPRVKR